MGWTRGVVRGASGGALACALCALLVGAAACRAQEPIAPGPSLREVIEAGRAAALDDRALAALLQAEGQDALPLIAWLVEGDAAVARDARARVLRVLPAALGERGQLLLVGLAGDDRPRDLRMEALAALGASADAGAAPAVLGHLADPDDMVRAAAVLAVSGVAGRGAEPVRAAVVRGLRDLLAHGAAAGAAAEEVRRGAGAVAALVAMHGDAALDDLVRTLSHPRVEVRSAALSALASPALLPERSRRVGVRAALLRALVAAPPRQAGAVDEKRLVLEALCTWGDPASCVLPVLEAIEADPACREPGLATLRRLVGRDAGDVAAWWRLWARGAASWPGLDVFLSTLEAGESDAVVTALDELAVLPDPRTFDGIERLVRRLEDADAWSRPWGEAQVIAACRALGALRDRRGVPALLVVMEAPGATDRARIAAHQALMRVSGRTGPAHVAYWRDVLPPAAPAPITSAAAWRLALLPPPLVPAAPSEVEHADVLAGAPARPAAVRDGERDLLALWPIAGALLTLTGVSMALRRRRDGEPGPDASGADAAASIDDASSAVAIALQSSEQASVPDLRRGSERRRFTAPPTFGPTSETTNRREDARGDDPADEGPAAEEDEGVVHVVLGTAPRWRAPAQPEPAPPAAPVAGEDPAWRESLDGLAELGPAVTRAWTRVRGHDGASREELVYDGDVGGRTMDDVLAALRERRAPEEVEVLEVELGGARLPLYRRADPELVEVGEPAGGEVTCVDDPAWRGLVAALSEMGPSVAAVWARLDDDGAARTLWSQEEPGGLDAALSALSEVRGRVREAGVRLVGSPADLVLFEGHAGVGEHAADGGSSEAEAGFEGTLEALRAMGGAVRMLAARLSIDAPAAGPRQLFPSPECRDLDDALAALESLEPVVVDVRARLVGAEADLVLLDRSAEAASPSHQASAARGARDAGRDAWEDLVAAIEELAPRLEQVVVRGTDGEDLVVFADDDGGVPALLEGLRSLQGLVAHVRVRLAGSEAELVLLDSPLAARRGTTFRELVGGVDRSKAHCLAA